MQITAGKDGLVFEQQWDGQRVQFLPESPTAFFSPDEGVEIKFVKVADGSFNALSVFDRDFFDRVR